MVHTYTSRTIPAFRLGGRISLAHEQAQTARRRQGGLRGTPGVFPSASPLCDQKQDLSITGRSAGNTTALFLAQALHQSRRATRIPLAHVQPIRALAGQTVPEDPLYQCQRVPTF